MFLLVSNRNLFTLIFLYFDMVVSGSSIANLNSLQANDLMFVFGVSILALFDSVYLWKRSYNGIEFGHGHDICLD